ncbi:MAG: PocR ligand-binding domain-containing protein [Deltaproteobacteria bacterium]|nr:PocR ligand-binding domain-containing protein [Deltaproteobacteria bacterium]
MTAPSPAELATSVLQRSFGLSELLDLASFKDVCESYADLFHIGLKVFDGSRELLIDVRGSSTDFCSYAFSFPEGKARCMYEVQEIRHKDVEGVGPEIHNCFTGLRYLIVPIRHEGDVLGHLVYGPYRPSEKEATDLSGLGEKYNPEVGNRLLGQVRAVPHDVALQVVRHLVQVIEVALFTGYKQLLTSRMHVEAVTASYTELQNKNSKLRESFDRLKELDRLKSSFLATVSHELRTPLTSVIGYSEMLIEGLAGEMNEEQHEYVKTIMEKGENLLALISGILDFSKVESGNLRLNKKPTYLTEIFKDALSTVIPLVHKQGLSLEQQLPDQLPQLNLDGDKIRQSLVNLLSNAVKFNREGGKVGLMVDNCERVLSSADDLPAALAPVGEACLRIRISDTGIGIPPEKLDRVFDSFYQVDGSSTREYGGTGLGLAISRSFIEAHGGTLEVESEMGKGSVFTIILPLDALGVEP